MKKFYFIYLIFIVFFLQNCNLKQKINIGFLGSITAKNAHSGINMRNGALLAVAHINQSGGILGKKIKMIVENDKNRIDKAIQTINKFHLQDEVIAIIGPMTSHIGLGIIENINIIDLVCISPAGAATDLRNLDDNFFTFAADNTDLVRLTVQRMNQDYQPDDKIAVFYQVDNKKYVLDFLNIFFNSSLKYDLKDITKIPFSTYEILSYKNLVHSIGEKKPAKVLILANEMNTAIIAQNMKIISPQTQLYGSEWAMTPKLIEYGGKAVDGMFFSTSMSFKNITRQFLDFKKKYIKTYGYEPSPISYRTYEATLILFEAIKNARCNKKKIKTELLKIKNYPGLLENFNFNRYGDIERKTIGIVIKDGKMVELEE